MRQEAESRAGQVLTLFTSSGQNVCENVHLGNHIVKENLRRKTIAWKIELSWSSKGTANWRPSWQRSQCPG